MTHRLRASLRNCLGFSDSLVEDAAGGLSCRAFQMVKCSGRVGQPCADSRGCRASRNPQDYAILLILGLLSLVLVGCREELQTQYGQRKGPGSSSSVNGTAVLGEVFEQKGHSVLSWGSLSPKLRKRADVIV